MNGPWIMDMWNLLAAEWMKTWRRPLDRRLAVAAVVIAPLLPAIWRFGSLAGHSAVARGLETGSIAWTILGFLAAPVLAANAIGHELSHGTWPYAVALSGRRGLVFVSKAVVYAVYCLLTICATAAACVLMACFTRPDVRTVLDAASPWMSVGHLLAACVGMWFFGAVAMLGTAGFRSVPAGLGLGLLLQLLPSDVVKAPMDSWSPWHHIQEAHFIVSRVRTGFEWRPAALWSAVIVLGFAALVVATGCSVVRKQDL